jgi:hypothetical protein
MDKERKPLLYDKSKFTGYDGEKEFFISQSLWHDIHNWKTDYILINRTNYDISIEDEYADFIIKAQQLKEASEGKINLYKTGNDKITALNLFDRYTKHISHPPIIEQVEADIINDASHGAIIFFDKYEGPAHKADIKSMYPSILKSGLCFPIGEGELKYITELNEILQYGIYKCIVSGDISKKTFRINYSNWYTHIDLNRARELKLNIDLIIDDSPNFLYYSRDKLLTGHELFGQYVETLFNLKDNKIKGAKSILNILYGALCEKIKVKNNVKIDQEFEIPDNCHHQIKPSNFDENVNLIYYTKRDRQYKTPYARIMPFILAKGRSIISKIIEPIQDQVKRCHTDGIVYETRASDKLKFGSKIGELIYEGYTDNCKILNCNNVRGF